MRTSATISEDGTYRYVLRRAWGPEPLQRVLGFVMLNPSTADAIEDDPTIRRCMSFAKRDGYDGIVVVNLFDFRATNPKALCYAERDLSSRKNDPHIGAAFKECDEVVFAWGVAQVPGVGHRISAVVRLAKEAGHVPLCLGINLSGAPKHPLYLPRNARMVAWSLSTA